VRVSRSSTISVRTNTYSVPSRLIGELVDLRIGAEQITVSHHGHAIQTMPRLVGKKPAAINYRHIIDSLVRKLAMTQLPMIFSLHVSLAKLETIVSIWLLSSTDDTDQGADNADVQLAELIASNS